MNLCYLFVLLILLITMIYLLIIKTISRRPSLYNSTNFSNSDTQPLRGICALLIIATHVSFKFSEEIPFWGMTSFGAPIVSIFFFLSGYGLTVQYKKRGLNYLNGFIQNSFLKLLPPFLIATFTWIIVSYLLFNGNPLTELVNMLVFNPPLPYSWFIYVLVLFYVGFYIIYRTNHITDILRQLLLIFFTLSITIILRKLDFGVYWYISLFAFNMGNIIGSNNQKFYQILNLYPILITILTSFVLCILMILNIRTGLLSVIPIGVMLPIIILGSGKSFTILFKLGKKSYEIYLAHGIIIPVLSLLNLNWIEFLVYAEIGSISLAYIIYYTNSIFRENIHSLYTKILD